MATANGDNKALMQQIKGKYESGVALAPREFGAVVKGFRSQMEEALPLHLKKNVEKYMRQTMMLFNQNPKLQQCSAVSIIGALMTASSLGLDLTPQLGQCYIIPYSNKKYVNGQWETYDEAQFQFGYRGIISLAQRSGEVLSIRAEVVHEKDEFTYSRGIHPTLEHVDSDEENPGPITHVYAIANFKNGGYAFEVWPVNKVLAHAQKFSKSFYKDEYVNKKKTGNKIENQSSPWSNNFEAMAKKTLIMAISKFLPVSTELQLAFASDEAVRTDIKEVKEEKDIINMPIQRIEYEQEDEPQRDEGQQRAIDSSASPYENSISDLLGGDGGLGLTQAEQEAFIKKHTGKTLEELSDNERAKIVTIAQVELQKRFGAEA